MSKSVVCALWLTLTGCVGAQNPPPINVDRETCYANARLHFHANAEKCETEACIDALGEKLAEEKAACP